MNYYRVIIFLLLPTFSFGQEVFVSFKPKESHWREDEILLVFCISPGFHIQADSSQISSPNFIPSHLSLNLPKGVQIQSLRFPPANRKWVGTMETQVFSHRLILRICLLSQPLLEMIPQAFSGILYYQPCDVNKCFFPRSLPFSFSRQAG